MDEIDEKFYVFSISLVTDEWIEKNTEYSPENYPYKFVDIKDDINED